MLPDAQVGGLPTGTSIHAMTDAKLVHRSAKLLLSDRPLFWLTRPILCERLVGITSFRNITK
jgi:hypothetical protein